MDSCVASEFLPFCSQSFCSAIVKHVICLKIRETYLMLLYCVGLVSEAIFLGDCLCYFELVLGF